VSVFRRADSPYWWVWLEGARQPRVNTKIPIGTTQADKHASRRNAETIYHRLMANRARTRFGLPTEHTPRLFVDQRAWYFAHVSVHKRGVDRERSMLKQLGAFFDAYDLAAIDVPLTREWRTWRRLTVSASTVNREEEILKHMLRGAVPKYLQANPLAGLTRLRTEEAETRILTPDEEDRLLTAAVTDAHMYAAVLCGLDGLMRRGSVANLKRAQDHGTYVTLLNAKTGTYKVPVSARLRAALDRIPGTGGRFFEPHWAYPDIHLSRLFSALCKRAHVATGRQQGGVTFHSLRHTGASRMLARGVDVKTVMLIGGWHNLAVLERYLHPTDERKLEAVNVIGSRPTLVKKEFA
jgi:integrase